MCLHLSLNNKKNRESSGCKKAVCGKTAGLGSAGNFSDLNSACFKMLVPIKIFRSHALRN